MGAKELQFKTTTKDGDGGDTEIEGLANINVKKVDNGWIINTEYDDADDVTEVFNNTEQSDGNRKAIQAIIESMGLENEVFLK